MRKKCATPDIHPSLNHRCPFCHADPGQSCLTLRGHGHEREHPHMQRIALAFPRERKQAPRVPALCCECGNQRTVSANHSRGPHDPNYSYGDRGQKDGWRLTQTLKCDACGTKTRHALLRPDDEHRDWEEQVQRYILGGEFENKYAPDRERLRAEYFAKFPQNPNLKHRYYVAEAERAWDDGTKQVAALCGAPMEIDFDPYRKTKNNNTPGQLVAEQVSDTEYEDSETGLWWIDMDCVDCCRVSNDNYRATRRLYLEKLLAWFAARPERIPDSDVEVIIENLVRNHTQ